MKNNLTEVAVLGGGCFWCTEAVFKILRGVAAVAPGYAGGTKEKPTYEQVSAGTTGHAEVVRIEYDPRQISFRDTLTVFFATHDPRTPNRQGPDGGPQYRSAIFYTTAEQKKETEDFIKELNASSPGDATIVTEVKPFAGFHEAEKYHYDYYAKNQDNSYCRKVINPKLQKVKEKYAALLKSNK